MRIPTPSIIIPLLAGTIGALCSTSAQDSPVASPTMPPPATQKATDSEAPANEARKKSKRTKAKKGKGRGKKPVTPIDYGQWERLTGEKISADGKWLVYTIQRVDKERTLFLHKTDAKKKEPVASFQHGESPKFSDNSKWLALTIGKSPEELKKAKDSKAKPNTNTRTIKLRHLPDDSTTEFKNVQSLSFSADSRFATIELAPKPTSTPDKPGGSSSTSALLVRDLEKQTDTTFGNVIRHSWSQKGSLLAMVVDSPSISNALQLFDPSTGVLRVLDTSDQEYAHLIWRKDSFDLAAMREMKHEDKEDVSHVLLAWQKLNQESAKKHQFSHPANKRFPNEMFIPAGGLEWSTNGKALYCNLKKWEKKPAALKPKDKNKKEPKGEEDKKAAPPQEKKQQQEEPAARKPAPAKPEKKTLRESLDADSNVEVWHSKDTRIMPKQKKMADSLKNPKRRAVWWIGSDKFVQLGNELTENVELPRTGIHALGSDRTPHERTAMFGPRLQDIHLINTRNGDRKLIVEAVKHQLKTSPNGRYILYLHQGHVWSHDARSGEKKNLTDTIDSHFTNQEDDTLAVEKPPYGRGEWMTDSSRVLLYDRYDIWSVAPDGSGSVRLTDGRENKIRHRLSRASYREKNEGYLDPRKPLHIALYGELTKKSGYGRLAAGGDLEQAPAMETLLWADKQIAALQRAEKSDVFLFTEQSYKESPNLFLAGPDLSNASQLTHTNTFQKKYRWGHSELIDYTNANGTPLQGALTYPANYKPGKKYPMIVYIYEKRSQQLHQYQVPSETHPYNPAVFSAEGYFVFQPDIVYRPQEPGISAVECVVPAVKEVLKTGMIDKKAVGLVGHSWGAYQTAFIVTQTDLFAAGVAGAPLTDMMSMSVSVYWNTGGTNAAIFAQSQGRMSTPFWRDPENYVRNSPIHALDELNTPLLIAFGDNDGAVDFDQGVQMYNAARWAGKDDFIMLVYPGENHGLRREENMVDYHYRILEWFGHYLQQDEPEKWITDGTSYLERQKELEARKEKKEAPKKP